jgi:hypothetical protein
MCTDTARHTVGAMAMIKVRRGTRRRAAARELAIFAAAYLTYFGVRAVTQGRADDAFRHASALVRFERSLGVSWEQDVQAVVVGSHLLTDAANAVYIYGHWPVLLVTGLLLYRYRREHYYLLRNACLLSGAVGLVIFALYPVAPPRLLALPLVDTVTLRAPGYRDVLPPSLVNEYAAMPSFHAGWIVLAGVVVFGASHNRAVRAFAVAIPVLMVFAVIATANHFVLDVIAGSAIALAALPVVRRWRGGSRGAA